MKIYDSCGNVIKPCNALGEEICVMDAVKAQLEWHEEYERAENYCKAMILETAIILVSIVSILCGCKLGSRLRKEG